MADSTEKPLPRVFQITLTEAQADGIIATVAVASSLMAGRIPTAMANAIIAIPMMADVYEGLKPLMQALDKEAFEEADKVARASVRPR